MKPIRSLASTLGDLVFAKAEDNRLAMEDMLDTVSDQGVDYT